LICCVRPGPDDPGGLGAEESETERTGPTQCSLFANQRGRRLAEKGLYCDSANDPVTALVVPIPTFASHFQRTPFANVGIEGPPENIDLVELGFDVRLGARG
jgi:hypothetical protein